MRPIDPDGKYIRHKWIKISLILQLFQLQTLTECYLQLKPGKHIQKDGLLHIYYLRLHSCAVYAKDNAILLELVFETNFDD